ncbi:MAG: hypothetical protein LBV19_08980, partial [Streptococcaceae bacterium]|nr:hypothetical protein [Streptococcaceae bacterium]
KKRELEAFLFFAEIKVRAKKYKNLKNPPSFPVDCLQSEKLFYNFILDISHKITYNGLYS